MAMGASLRGRVSKSNLNLCNLSRTLSNLYSTNDSIMYALFRSHSFSSFGGGGGSRESPSRSGDTFRSSRSSSDNNSDSYDNISNGSQFSHQNIPEPIPNRPLRGERPISQSPNFPPKKSGNDDFGSGHSKSTQRNRPSRGNQSPPQSFKEFGNVGDGQKLNRFSQSPQSPQSPMYKGLSESLGNDFLDKFKLATVKPENPSLETPRIPKEEDKTKGDKAVAEPPPPPPQEADEIFKKMKETGLIPNAVAMLDGLCKDGLVQEAMKLFGLMREKGTIPEVVIYTAVVEGFCKAHKFDDAKRIFRKMQSNGIAPNTYSYTVLIQGLYKGRRLEDAIEFCVEMLEAGHSPNLATFTGLVDGFCREKGAVEEAQSVVRTLKEKGFLFDEKAVKEYLEKQGPFSQLIWEAIFGKNSFPKFF